MHACTHANTHAQGKFTTGKMFYPHLTFACSTVTPNSNVRGVLSLVSVSLFLTHFSTCSHRVALVTLYCSELRQRENEGGIEGVLPRLMREASKNAFRKKCIRTLHSIKNVTLPPLHCFTFFLFLIFSPPFLLPSSF